MLTPKRRRKAVVRMASVIKALAGDLDLDPSDTTYVLHRLHHEGPAFVTKTLPLISKYALASIEAGVLLDITSITTSFAVKRNGSPELFSGLLSEAVSGCAYALYRIRQFCEYFYKTAFDFSNDVTQAAEKKYVQVDLSVGDFDERVASQLRKAFFLICPSVVRLMPHELFSQGTRFGPGAFYGSERLSDNYAVYKKLPSGIIGTTRTSLRDYAGFFTAYSTSHKKRVDKVDGQRVITKGDRIVLVPEGRRAQLRFVPKDSRGPRVISKEPMHLLRAQMGAQFVLTRLLEHDTRRRINFVDQRVNQELAKESSVTRFNATIDLKDASDRVSNALVRYLMHGTAVGDFLQQLRSTSVELPSGEIHHLRKFANMGSGLCFPILALVVYLAGVVAVHHTSVHTLKEAAQLVYVYGDDLIVPSYAWDEVHRVFSALGLQINSDKSFRRGYFRESCGADYYHGTSVAPVRLRLSHAHLEEVSLYRNGIFPIHADSAALQVERHCRELVDSGLTTLASYYYRMLERKLGDLPFVHRDSVVLGRYDPSENPQNVESKGWFPSQEYIPDERVCPHKALSIALSGQVQGDWYLTPVRYSVNLKRRVLSPATFGNFGLPEDPREIFAW